MIIITGKRFKVLKALLNKIRLLCFEQSIKKFEYYDDKNIRFQKGFNSSNSA